MMETVGNKLRTRRQSGGLSLEALAQRAGVGKSTLSAWENGKALPRLAELEAVGAALGWSASERREILGLLDAPRAVQMLRQAEGIGPPVGGDLLRAMRLRMRRTQQDVAAQIGVSQSTLAKWERSEDWPASERLHALCFALKAAPEELQALTCGGRFLARANEDLRFDAVEFRNRLDNARHHIERGDETLRDLRFLSLEADLWRLGQHDANAALFLTDAYSEHAVMLAERGRIAEAGQYAEQVFERARRGLRRGDRWLAAAIAEARRNAQRGRPSDFDAAAQFLSRLLPEAQAVKWKAWLHSEIAWHLAQSGAIDAAIRESECGFRLSAQDDAAEYVEMWMRHLDEAKILFLAGRFEEAQTVCEDNGLLREGTALGVPALLLHAEVSLALGETGAAGAALSSAFSLIEAEHLEHFRAQSQTLAEKIEQKSE